MSVTLFLTFSDIRITLYISVNIEKIEARPLPVGYPAEGQASRDTRTERPPKREICLEVFRWGTAEYAVHCHGMWSAIVYMDIRPWTFPVPWPFFS